MANQKRPSVLLFHITPIESPPKATSDATSPGLTVDPAVGSAYGLPQLVSLPPVWLT